MIQRNLVNLVGFKPQGSLSVFICVCMWNCVFMIFFSVCRYGLYMYSIALYRADVNSNQHSYPIYEKIESLLVGKPQLPSSNVLGCPRPSPETQPLDCVEIQRLKKGAH